MQKSSDDVHTNLKQYYDRKASASKESGSEKPFGIVNHTIINDTNTD